MLARLADSIAVLVLALLAAALLHVAYSSSITADETAEIGGGVSIFAHGEIAMFEEHPPLTQLVSGAAVWALGVRPRSAEKVWPDAREGKLHAKWGWCERVLYDDNPDARFPFARPGLESIVVAARLPVLVFPLLLALVTYLWAKARFGPHGGLVALAGVVTYPDLLGHGALVATDVPFAAVALLAAFAADRRLEGGGRGWVVLSGAAAGLAVGTRLWGPILALALAVAAGEKRWRDTLAAAGVAALVLSVLYLGANPVRCYARGIAETLAQHGEVKGAVLLGHLTHGPHYLLLAGLLKLPPATIALAGGTLLLARREWRSPLHFPALLVFLTNSFAAAPYGTRYLLPVLPFLLVSSGRLAAWAAGSRNRLLALGLALVANVAIVVHEHPWHLGALDPLIPKPWRALDNSNTDWGQGLAALGPWQRAHGVASLVVVPRAAAPFQRVGDRVGLSADLRLAALQAYGVAGHVEGGEVLFHPRRGEVFAVSAHVVARAWIFETDEPLLWPSGARGPARLVLDRELPPDELVGGAFLIFDLREPKTR